VSSAIRDRVNEQVMNDPRIADMDPESMAFDGGRAKEAEADRTGWSERRE
jgi:hypothetical protein